MDKKYKEKMGGRGARPGSEASEQFTSKFGGIWVHSEMSGVYVIAPRDCETSAYGKWSKAYRGGAEGHSEGKRQSHSANSQEARFRKIVSCSHGLVLVDKNEGKSTAENPLGTKASARIVVPGCADQDVLDIRRDSPTACRDAINVLLAISARKKTRKLAITNR